MERLSGFRTLLPQRRENLLAIPYSALTNQFRLQDPSLYRSDMQCRPAQFALCERFHIRAKNDPDHCPSTHHLVQVSSIKFPSIPRRDGVTDYRNRLKAMYAIYQGNNDLKLAFAISCRDDIYLRNIYRHDPSTYEPEKPFICSQPIIEKDVPFAFTAHLDDFDPSNPESAVAKIMTIRRDGRLVPCHAHADAIKQGHALMSQMLERN